MAPRKDGQHRDRMVPPGWENKPGIEAILLGLRGSPRAIDVLSNTSGGKKVTETSDLTIRPSLVQQLITALPIEVTVGATQNISPALVQQLVTPFNIGINVPETDDDLSVTRLTSNTTLTDQGIYIVDSSAGIRTITLPLLSAVPITGYRIQIKREGANNVVLQRQGSDTFEDGTTTKTMFLNYSGFVCFADDAASDWMIGGFLGSVS